MPDRRCRLAAALIAALATAPLAVAPPGAAAQELSFIRGDVDQTGDLSVTDPIGGISYLFLGTGEPPCLDAVDADDSGLVDLSDAILVLSHLYFGQAPPSPPYPDCGQDPTHDPLGCARWDGPGVCPPPLPEDCANVVARAGERGCGRVFVWGDEHVGSEQYWPAVQPFWQNALLWLSETTCGPQSRWQIASMGFNPYPELSAFFEASGMTVTPIRSLVEVLEYDLLIAYGFWVPPEPGAAELVRDWVGEGGALMTLVAGVGDQHTEECEGINTLLAPLGIEYDCLHTAPWGPVSAFEDHPLASGLGAENAPFVNGRWVVESGGLPSEVVARVGDNCAPAEVPDCRKPVVFPVDDVPVESDCGDPSPSGGWPQEGPGPELHIIGIYEPAGPEVEVLVNRPGNIVLVLSSYESAHWTVIPEHDTVIERVILNGYDRQTATLPPESAVASYSIDEGSYQGIGYGDDCGGGDTVKLISSMEGRTGLTPRSFHGCYRASSFTFAR